MITPLKKNKLCFVLMPFAKNRLEIYKRAIEPACKEANFKAVRVDELKGVYNINRKIIEHIFKSEVVIAELTDMNPNVFYEMGVAHTIDNKTIMITQSAEKLPFDISGYRCIIYDQSDDGFQKLQEELVIALQTINDWSQEPCNPVQDFKPAAPFVPVGQFQDLQKALQERERELLSKDSPLRQAILTLKQAISPIKSKSLQSDLIEKEKSYKVAIAQLETIKAELEKKNVEIRNLTQEIQTYHKAVQNQTLEKEKSYEITVSKLEAVKAELEKKNNEIRKLQQQLHTYSTKFNSLQSESIEREKGYKTTVSQREAIETELDRKNAEIRELKQEFQRYSFFITPAEARRRFMQLVKQKCGVEWAWNQHLIEILIHSLRANELLPKAPFNLDCPNKEKKSCGGVHNKAEEWIFRPNPEARCWNCRQILLHTSKLESTDPKLLGANILLIAIEFFQLSNAVEINDEPIGFNSREKPALEIGNFKVYGRGQAAVLHDRLQHYKLAAVDGEFKYEVAVLQAYDELQLSSFDIVKPLFDDSTVPEIYYLFMDISKLI